MSASLNLGKLHRVRAVGEDLQGNSYESLEQMWKTQITAPLKSKVTTRRSTSGTATKQSWYKVAVDYWDRQPATVDGVLGGFEDIHETESQTSERMIREHLKYMPGKDLALDCGAGIGRVTKTVLKHIFKNVDLLEPSKTQMVEARKYCPEARKFHHIGLQEFGYKEPYDAIWIQWVLCYLTDEDIVHFLLKTKRDGLTRDEKGKTGLIFIKENTSEQSQFLLDTE